MGIWKPFKHSRHHTDADMVTLFRAFAAEFPRHRRNIVLNGDNFDFRMVQNRPDGGQDPYGLPATGRNSAWKLEQIVREHLEFFSFLADFLEDNHLHIVPGNHDVEFNFSLVRLRLRQLLYKLSSRKSTARDYYRRIRFYQNHIYQPGFFYCEHGHHYDDFCTLPQFRIVRGKPGRENQEMILPFGDYASVFLTNQMGHFNPFHDESYLLRAREYARIFFKYNFWRSFTFKNLALTWFWGSVRTLARAFRVGMQMRGRIAKLPIDTEMPRRKLREIQGLYPPNIYRQPGLIWRTLWMDRVLLIVFVALGGLSWLVWPSSWQITLPLLAGYFVFYLWNIRRTGNMRPQGRDIRTLASRLDRIVDTPVIVMGHTHKPRTFPVNDGHRFFDLGSWSPYFQDVECEQPLYDKRWFLALERSGGEIRAHYSNWPEFKKAGGMAPGLLEQTWTASESRVVNDVSPKATRTEKSKKNTRSAAAAGERSSGH